MNRPEPFGAAAVRLGYATEDDVSKVLREQHARKAKGETPGLIGTLMEEMGILSPEQLERVVKQLAANRIHLSEDAIRLAAHLKAVLAEDDKVLVVTGAAHGDGVSEAVTQMGGALALMGGGPVLVVDANVRAPSLHSIFGVEQIPGLADVLAGRAELDAALRSNEATLVSVLPSGNPTDDFLSLLMSQECVSLLDRLRARFRFILVDTPPMLLYPESSLMASRSDGVVAVLRTWERNKSELFEIQRILGALRVTLFGVALTERAKQTGRARLGQRR